MSSTSFQFAYLKGNFVNFQRDVIIFAELVLDNGEKIDYIVGTVKGKLMTDGWTRSTPYEDATHAEREEIRRQELPEVFKTDELDEWLVKQAEISHWSNNPKYWAVSEIK